MMKELAARTTPVKLGGTGADTIEEARENIMGYVPGCCKIVKKNDTTSYSSDYNYFDPLYGTVETTMQMGENIYQDQITLPEYGDRSETTVTGIRIGAGVNYVRVAGSVRYRNESASSVALHTIVYRARPLSDGTFDTSVIQTLVAGCEGETRCSHTLDTLVDVEEGDFVSFQSYKGIASRDVDVLHSTYATQMTVEAIG